MQRKSFAVDITKQQLTFSAAHFITFAGDICEALHGHNYGVSCRVEGPLDANRYVIDFIALRDHLAQISRELDHHVLLPTSHPLIRVHCDAVAGEVIATFRDPDSAGKNNGPGDGPGAGPLDRRWIFPRGDCVLLPVSNTTAEEIAGYFVDRLLESLGQHLRPELVSLTVRIDENQGQWGECRHEF